MHYYILWTDGPIFMAATASLQTFHSVFPV